LITHGPGSWGAIKGLGSFDMSGTTNWITGETDVVLSGTDTLSIYVAPEGACWSMDIDGEPVELSGLGAPVCED
jgi:hypothetical protein